MKYIRYELELRKYSSNVILGVRLVEIDGKLVEKKDKIIASIANKEVGDQFIEEILNHLNSKL